MKRKRILCYGDSNTWGSTDHDTRMDEALQWPVILQKKLGNSYNTIQEGLGGRVAGDYEPKTYRNGKRYYEIAFRSASPVSVVIVSLGTNDLKTKYARRPDQIVDDLLWYADETKRVEKVNEGIRPVIIYVAPANFVSSKYFEAHEKVRTAVINLLTKTKEQTIVLPEVPMTSDGVHYSKEAHETVAEKVFEKITELGI